MILEFDGIRPEIHPDAWVAPTAVLIGRVVVRAGASIWWGAVLRGDNEPIVVGEHANVQDGCVLHTDPGFPLEVGPEVTVGHQAMLHGCTVEEGALVGIGAVILNGARIGREALIGAKALVPEGREIPARALALGIPARVRGEVSPDQAARMRRGTRVYVERARLCRTRLRRLDG